jgi:hypothetical protein
MKNIRSMVFLFISLLLTSCGGSSGGGSSASKKPLPVKREHNNTLELEMSGIYQAILNPINDIGAKYLNGSVTASRDGDEFVINVRFAGGHPKVLHSQHIYYGSRCPTWKDDLNNDGFIDANEAARVVKDIIIPIDDDINSHRMGGGIYPETNDWGYFQWSRTASFEKLLEDLREVDINPKDDIMKLKPNETLNLQNKVVLIRGVHESVSLPETVSGRGRELPHQALPVACGVFKKITRVPGVIQNDETDITVPSEGGSIGGTGGYDDGVDFSVGTTTGGHTGNYGDDDDDEVNTPTNSTEHGTGGRPGF